MSSFVHKFIDAVFSSLFKSILFLPPELFESKWWMYWLKAPKTVEREFPKPRLSSHDHGASAAASNLTLLRRRWLTCGRARVPRVSQPFSYSFAPHPGPGLAGGPASRAVLSPVSWSPLPLLPLSAVTRPRAPPSRACVPALCVVCRFPPPIRGILARRPRR